MGFYLFFFVNKYPPTAATNTPTTPESPVIPVFTLDEGLDVAALTSLSLAVSVFITFLGTSTLLLAFFSKW